MTKYRKKPVVIEAMRFTEDTKSDDVKAVFGVNPIEADPNGYYIHTLEGAMEIRPGNYILRGVHGEFYPCQADIFHETYEKVEE